VIDLHSHLLPGIDDGAADLSVSIEMARMAVAGGVKIQACTPHIMPGVFNNSGPQIRRAIADLQKALDDEGIPLRLVSGADNHLVPDMIGGLKYGQLLSLADTRYLLVEPPHHVPPTRLLDMLFGIMVAGYHPIITHPERFGWIRSHYHLIEQLAQGGAWMQITASSLTGAFGHEPLYWAERMLSEGLVHIMASDAHDTRRRPPNLLVGVRAAARRVGDKEAVHLVVTRPLCILKNQTPASAPDPIAGGLQKEILDEAQSVGALHKPRLAAGERRGTSRRFGSELGRSGWLERMRGLFNGKS